MSKRLRSLPTICEIANENSRELAWRSSASNHFGSKKNKFFFFFSFYDPFGIVPPLSPFYAKIKLSLLPLSLSSPKKVRERERERQVSSPTSIFIFDRRPELVYFTFLAETISSIASYFSRIAAIFPSEKYNRGVFRRAIFSLLRFYHDRTENDGRWYGAARRRTTQHGSNRLRAIYLERATRRLDEEATTRDRSPKDLYVYIFTYMHMHRYTRRVYDATTVLRTL